MPKTRPKGVVDGFQVNIPGLRINYLGVTGWKAVGDVLVVVESRRGLVGKSASINRGLTA